MSGITGGYPGGPPRHDPERQTAGSDGSGLRSGETVEAGVEGRVVRDKRKKRNRRLAVGLVASLIVAAGVGAYVGLKSRETAEDLARKEAESAEPDLGREADRLLNELWKMEDLERINRR